VNKRQQFIEGANKPFAENPEKHRDKKMSGVMKDFLESRKSICGYGLFEGIAEATAYAEKISENQLRRLIRYGLVPAAFIDFLVTMGIRIDRKKCIRREMTEGHLAWLLMTGNYIRKCEKAEATAEYLGKMILLTMIHELARSFRITQDMESAMRLYQKEER